MELFSEVQGKGTYATRENAVKRLAALLGDNLRDYRYLIGVNADGRFFPVVVLTRDQQYQMMFFATNNVCVTF